MRKYFIQTMMANLEAWIEHETHPAFKELYTRYYHILEKK